MIIKALRAADKDMLRALARAGVCSQLHFKHFGNSSKGISLNRVKQHVKDGLIATDRYWDKQSRRYSECYVLTSKGVTMAKERLGINYVYSSNSRVHDLALMDKYTSLNKAIQGTWKTESDIRYEAYNRFNDLERQQLEEGSMSPPDALYISNGTVIAYEIVTSNYRKNEIQAKETFVETMNIDLQIRRI